MTPEKIATWTAFLNGVIALGHATAGLFFLRFWKRTNDRLFLLFSIAFLLLGAVRLAMEAVGQPDEENFLYWFRLVAYLLILAAIADKNLRK
jgi:hypothetical protein